MSIQINRFEPKPLEKVTQMNFTNKTAIIIKDHKTDNIISHIQLFNDVKKNKKLANILIETIEDFIENEE